MASIFTYDPDPPRINSPWEQGQSGQDTVTVVQATPAVPTKVPGTDACFPQAKSITRLQAEPQEGPVEYKLHLLLGPRRKFVSTSTGNHISGSRHSTKAAESTTARDVTEAGLESAGSNSSAMPSSSITTLQARQHRLEQLTTQLLWRLQQSSPHHTSSATNIILPSLPEALPELEAPQQLAKLPHGLEESQGALYEIGVSDDGTLVGLAEDEMQSSLNNLRAMAACLGCTVEILRKEIVGECQWIDGDAGQVPLGAAKHTGNLVVAEALVKPMLQASSPLILGQGISSQGILPTMTPAAVGLGAPVTEQLRVTLTGPTMSGKSSLLGTLSTSTLDNGRGKSRLSMLKHRHEITTGITSSVTQELLGYQDTADGSVNVINYATENIASWIDIHAASAGSRLVFVSDSAGHPRYRRTTLRGLIGWAPNWTLLCIPADDTEDTAGSGGGALPSQHASGSVMPDLDLSGAQLDLCVRLGLPLVIVITKLDLASRTGLRKSLSKILDVLKAARKKPAIFPSKPGSSSEKLFHFISPETLDATCNATLPLLNDPTGTVPIVLTSVVDGTGISTLHALLHELPLPDHRPSSLETPHVVFDIEDVYSKPAEVSGLIVSGHLRAGRISVGDRMFIGPFSANDHLDDSEDSDERSTRRKSDSRMPTSRSFPGALRGSSIASTYFNIPGQEWRPVVITSIRNLRLPVHTLLDDQVGTLALVPDIPGNLERAIPGISLALPRIRKGMVLTPVAPPAIRTFTVRFLQAGLDTLTVGSHAVIYIASVRASARVVSAQYASASADPTPPSNVATPIADHTATAIQEPFVFDDEIEPPPLPASAAAPKHVSPHNDDASLLVTFSFDASKEFVLLGDRVLVMPGGGPGLYAGHERGEKGAAGLDGFVGNIVHVHA